jgi:hypothetical protein
LNRYKRKGYPDVRVNCGGNAAAQSCCE